VRVTGLGRAEEVVVCFAEGGAVPGEVHPFRDRFAVGCHAEFGRAAAQGVVGVAPEGAVRGDDGGQAVFVVPIRSARCPACGTGGSSGGVMRPTGLRRTPIWSR
jgi:hypothetical protein